MLFLKKKRNNILLVMILLISLVSELCLILIRENSLSINTYVFLLFILWFCILLPRGSVLEKYRLYTIASFIFACGLNLLLYQNWWCFNYYNFIIGSLLYCCIFLYRSYIQLKRENFNFFISNHYLLLSSPVIFFLGMSFLFAFGSSELFSIKIYKDTTVYTIVGHFVNFIYYSLLNCYIYKENKSHV